MRVTIYDKSPGPGFMQWCLKTCWLLGCIFQKFVGAVDDYHGASSWTDARAWLMNRKTPLSVIQYWGHGSPGTVWLNLKPISTAEWLSLKSILTPDSLVWFRVCSAFQDRLGQVFAKQLADELGCTIGGHTRIIGLFQGGLYTIRPNSMPSWNVSEGMELSHVRADFKPWLKHTIFCLRTSIPKGW